jgi:transcription initiation factor TFIID subunit TAF12
MDWIRRNKSPSSNKIDDPALHALQELMIGAGISMPQGALNTPAKQKMPEESLRWLRRCDVTIHHFPMSVMP